MKQFGIYGFHSCRDKKWYVGQSCNMVRRCQEHLQLLAGGKHDNRLFQRGYTRCREDDFEYMVLSRLSLSLFSVLGKKELRNWLNTTEKLWIQTLEARVSGYNQTIGGAGSSTRNLCPWGKRFTKKRVVGRAYWHSLR